MSAAPSQKTPAPPSRYCDDPFNREVLRGVELMSPRPALPDAYCATQLMAQVGTAFGRRRGPSVGEDGWFILVEPELHLEDEDPIIPDIAGWRKQRLPAIPRAAFLRLPPDWACEIISPSNEKTDRTLKMAIYADAGVGHLWLVDPLKRRLEVYTLGAGGYGPALFHQGDQVVSVAPFEALALELSELWLPAG